MRDLVEETIAFYVYLKCDLVSDLEVRIVSTKPIHKPLNVKKLKFIFFLPDLGNLQ